MLLGIPIDPGFLAVGEIRCEEIEKHLLFVAIVVRMAGRDLARPVIGEAHALQLRAHRRDVFAGPHGGMGVAGNRRVLGRQPERVPPHRVQDVVALGAAIARDEVAHRVVAHMTDMQFARRIGKHLEDVVFRPCRILPRDKAAALLPSALPLRFGFTKIVPRCAGAADRADAFRHCFDCVGVAHEVSR